MNEKEAINILLIELIKIYLKKSGIFYDKKSDELIRKAENIINSLNEEDKDKVSQYVNGLIGHMAEEETYIYTAGIKDGIRLLYWITTIVKEDIKLS